MMMGEKRKIALTVNGKRYEDQEVEVVPVSTGNPHSVTFVEDVFKLDLNVIGPLAETHRAFPNRVNAHWAEVISPTPPILSATAL